jgi:hypothetical protein
MFLRRSSWLSQKFLWPSRSSQPHVSLLVVLLVVPEIPPEFALVIPKIPQLVLELSPLVIPDIPPATPLIPLAVLLFISDVPPIKPLVPPVVIPFVLDVPPFVPLVPPVARGNPPLIPTVPGATPFVPDIPELLPVVLDDPRIISAIPADPPVAPLVPPTVLVRPFTFLDDKGINRFIDGGSSEIVDGANSVLHQLVGGGNNGADGALSTARMGHRLSLRTILSMVGPSRWTAGWSTVPTSCSMAQMKV